MPYAAQALKNRTQLQASERSNRTGRLNTPIYAMRQGLGNPLAFIVMAGEVHDRMLVAVLIAECEASHTMANKAYDLDVSIPMIQAKGTATVIALWANRAQPRECEEPLYLERHGVACLTHKIKLYPWIFLRFAKTARSISSSLLWAGTRIEL